jgi:hypothetical protein
MHTKPQATLKSQKQKQKQKQKRPEPVGAFPVT